MFYSASGKAHDDFTGAMNADSGIVPKWCKETSHGRKQTVTDRNTEPVAAAGADLLALGHAVLAVSRCQQRQLRTARRELSLQPFAAWIAAGIYRQVARHGGRAGVIHSRVLGDARRCDYWQRI